MIKIFILLASCFISSLHAQDKAITDWINNNAIVIEDTNPHTQLTAFAQNVPKNFKNARIFGFGEASHHGKEFFDLKAKFFKYLVEHQGVRLFLMEDCYQGEKGINDWITGGKGDARNALQNFGHGIWYTNEVAGLLQWMRDYNLGKPYEDQIRFYGIDNQFRHDINIRLRDYIKKHDIVIDEKLLVAADSCSAAKMIARGVKNWDKKMLPKLLQIRQVLEQSKQMFTAANEYEYKDMMRGLGYLEQYTAFIAQPYQQVRENDMYNNVLKVLELEKPGSKAFIWAHNEHVNNKDLGGYKIKNLGNLIKTHFKDEYYAVGFDFGSGSLKGYNFKDGKNLGRVVRTLDRPYKKTYAEILVQGQPDVYFIDMVTAMANPVAAKFFSSKKKQLFLGGPGFDPKNNFFIKRSYAEAYDGIIFVKKILPSTY